MRALLTASRERLQTLATARPFLGDPVPLPEPDAALRAQAAELLAPSEDR